MSQEYRTINTFTRKPSVSQIASYIIISIEVVVFYLMIFSSFEDYITRTICIVLFSTTLIIMFGSTLYCSITDPSDQYVVQFKSGKAANITSGQFSSLLYCDLCDSHVEMNSRHCRQCQRCVSHFDHHCMWINNCIGSKNYRVFIVMITSTWLNITIFLISTLLLSLEDNWASYFGFMVTSWVFSAVMIVLMILLLNLILLHIYLMCNGYTTYQFILARKQDERRRKCRQKKQEEEKQKETLRKQKSKKVISEDDENLPQQHILGHKKTNKVKIFRKDLRQQDANLQQNQQEIFENTDNVLHADNAWCKVQLYDQNNVFREIESSSGSKSNQVSVKIGEDIQDQNRQQGQKKSKTKTGSQISNDEQEQIKMSKFLIKNKSFGLILGEQVAVKPKKQNVNTSAHIQLTSEQKTQIKPICSEQNVKHSATSSKKVIANANKNPLESDQIVKR